MIEANCRKARKSRSVLSYRVAIRRQFLTSFKNR